MTQPALVLAPLACAAVLLLSGVAKLRDAEGTRSSFAAMRVPAWLNRPSLVLATPVAEIVLGVLLLITWDLALALVGAVVTALFSAYWLLVLRVLRSGDDVDCGCFGAVGDDKVSATTLVRNSLLVVLAAAAAAFGGAGSGVVRVLRDPSAELAWWLSMTVAVVATAVLVVRRGELASEPADDAEPLDYERTPIPFAVLQDANGDIKTLVQLASARPQLLVFLSSSCSTCHDVARLMPSWTDRLAPVQVQAVYTDRLDKLPEGARPDGVAMWHDLGMGATGAFATGGRPAAVLLGADGQLAGGPVNGKTSVLEFVEDIVAELEGRPAEHEKQPADRS